MSQNTTKIAIIGGGPAGLAAAVHLALKRPDARVELFEASSRLGGRTTSFTDPVSGVTLDTCQHVLMGCCTATIDFFKTLGLLDRFDVHDRYHFFDASGRCHRFAATRGLPAPLHLLPAFWRLKYLTRADRLRIMRSLRQLQKMSTEQCAGQTIGDWLDRQGQSRQACNRFWSVVLVSALSETLDRASLAAARKVFVDGFLASRDAYQLWTPRQPISTIFDQEVGPWLENRAVTIHRKTPIRRLLIEEKGKKGDWLLLPPKEKEHQLAQQQKVPVPLFSLETADSQTLAFDQVVMALPAHRLYRLLELSGTKVVNALFADLPTDQENKTNPVCFPPETSPIAAIHLWFDRPISDLPHAVLVDQHGNWMFRPPYAEPNYAQLVISAAHALLDLTRDARKKVIDQLAAELVQTAAGNQLSKPTPKLLRHHAIIHPRAVFSVTPPADYCRPESKTAVENLFLAGDWTATGWPATIEGAIRSGVAAAEQGFL